MTTRTDRAEKRFDTVQRFQASGLSQVEFAIREGIDRCTLQRWIKAAQHTPTQDVTEGGFLPLVVLQGKRGAVVEAVGQTDVLAEVVLRGGHSLSIKAGTSLSDLVTLFKALEQC